MIISPFTPLFFLNRKTDGRDSEYIQTFATTDRILLQMIGETSYSPAASVVDATNGRLIYTPSFSSWQINSDTKLYWFEMSLSPGYYAVYMPVFGYCEPFKVTDNPKELEETTLIQYSMNTNRQRNDVVFFIDGMQYFFDFRVPGGFKDSNWSFGVESEQFVTQQSDIVQLYGLESTQKRFTLGNSQGVPVWFGEMLNRLLVCSHVYFDGVKYSRKESNVPELTVQLEGVNSFVFNQTLQQSVNLDPVIEMNNQAIMRRVDNDNYRLVTTNINRLIH